MFKINQPSIRVQRISEAILKVLVLQLRDEVRDPRLKQAVISHVETAKDLSFARVFFLCDLNNKKEVSVALKSASGFFRKQIAQKLDLRVTPQLQFVFDEALERGNKLLSLIESANREDKHA